jgi:AhpC/TSA family
MLRAGGGAAPRPTGALGGGEVNTGREQYLQALAGPRETTRTQAERVAGLLAKQGEVQAGQVSRVAEDLSKVAREFAGRVGFVGVSYHDTVAAGRAYQRRFKVPYPLANDPSGRTWARWRVPYQPVTVLVDKQGRIAERFDGGTTGGTLRAALAYLVDE